MEQLQQILSHAVNNGYLNFQATEKHGLSHAIRTAILCKATLNFRKAMGDKDARSIDGRLTLLIQVAALFHDSARKGEGTDMWEKESAANLYKFLTAENGFNTLAEELNIEQVTPDEAQKLAEAMVNKSVKPKESFFTLSTELNINPVISNETNELSGAMVNKNIAPEEDFFAKKDFVFDFFSNTEEDFFTNDIKEDIKIKWIKNPNTDDSFKRTIISKIIHDGDCFEIIRARPGSEFDPSRLDIWQDYVQDKLLDFIEFKDFSQQTTKSVREIRKEILDLVDAQWYLLHITGDSYGDESDEIKQNLEQNEAYKNFNDLIFNEKDLNFMVLRAYLKYSEFDKINESINKELEKMSEQELKIFKLIEEKNLGIRGNKSPSKDSKHSKFNETSLEFFIRNIINGVNGQIGFPNRPISMFGVGVTPFTSSGFLINILPKDTQIVAYSDYNSSYGLKCIKINTKNSKIIHKKPADALNDLKEYLQSGNGRGSKNQIPEQFITHNEIAININTDNIVGVFFTEDYNFRDDANGSNSTAALNAIYTQLAYKEQTNKELPIYKISVYSKFPQVYTYTRENLLEILLNCYKNFIYTECRLPENGPLIEEELERDISYNLLGNFVFTNFLNVFEKTFKNLKDDFYSKYKDLRETIMIDYFVKNLKDNQINITELFNNLAPTTSFFNTYRGTIKGIITSNLINNTYINYHTYNKLITNKNFIDFLYQNNMFIDFITKIVGKLYIDLQTLNKCAFNALQKHDLLTITGLINPVLKLLDQNYNIPQLNENIEILINKIINLDFTSSPYSLSDMLYWIKSLFNIYGNLNIIESNNQALYTHYEVLSNEIFKMVPLIDLKNEYTDISYALSLFLTNIPKENLSPKTIDNIEKLIDMLLNFDLHTTIDRFAVFFKESNNTKILNKMTIYLNTEIINGAAFYKWTENLGNEKIFLHDCIDYKPVNQIVKNPINSLKLLYAENELNDQLKKISLTILNTIIDRSDSQDTKDISIFQEISEPNNLKATINFIQDNMINKNVTKDHKEKINELYSIIINKFVMQKKIDIYHLEKYCNIYIENADFINLPEGFKDKFKVELSTQIESLSSSEKERLSTLNNLLNGEVNPPIPNNPATLGINTISLPTVSPEKPNKDLSQSGKIVDLKDPQLDM